MGLERKLTKILLCNRLFSVVRPERVGRARERGRLSAHRSFRDQAGTQLGFAGRLSESGPGPWLRYALLVR